MVTRAVRSRQRTRFEREARKPSSSVTGIQGMSPAVESEEEEESVPANQHILRV